MFVSVVLKKPILFLIGYWLLVCVWTCLGCSATCPSEDLGTLVYLLFKGLLSMRDIWGFWAPDPFLQDWSRKNNRDKIFLEMSLIAFSQQDLSVSDPKNSFCASRLVYWAELADSAQFSLHPALLGHQWEQHISVHVCLWLRKLDCITAL